MSLVCATARWFEDAALLVTVAALPFLGGAVFDVLALAIAAVLAWGLVTLHFPTRVAIDDRGVSFARYGREHRFAWSDVERVTVRRFLTRDRVLVRIAPSSAWRGRYWLLRGARGFDEIVAALEERASTKPTP